MALRIFMLISLLLREAVAAAPDPNTASIQGRVTARDTGKPLSDALIIARAMPEYSTRQTAKSAADGSFRLQNLPGGSYAICVKPADDGYLDPCEWTPAAVSIAVATGQQLSGNALAVASGSVVKIRIEDSSQLLFQKTKTGFLPDLLVGVFGPNGLFYPAHVVNRDIRGLSLQLTIPFDTPLALSIASRALKLADTSGPALPGTGAQTVFQHGRADPSPPTFSYTVTGIVP
jgi:hypothetical protein